jgi:hypothetical protein
MAYDCSEIATRVRIVWELNSERVRLSGGGIKNQQLGPPASPESIDAVESKLGRRFPPDYRCFLERHDGWQAFNGDNDLLSTSQILGGPTAEWIERLKGYQPATAAARALAIFASPFTSTLVFFDPASARADGNMDVVYWNAQELARYRSFADFLDGWADMLRRNIKEAQDRLREP